MTNKKKTVCLVIPARLGSTRLPEKALADIHGKPMIIWVLEKAMQVRGVDTVLVATDHGRIAEIVKKHGGKVAMTPETLQSGTDRVAYVAEQRSEDYFLNVQGDEPMLDPIAVERTLDLLLSETFEMATPAAPIQRREDLFNPNVVKVLVANDLSATYFSRHPIPYSRIEAPKDISKIIPLHHLGVYGYSRSTLIRFAKLERSSWEVSESLEQLRALYYGIRIGVARADFPSNGVDTPEDLERVRSLML